MIIWPFLSLNTYSVIVALIKLWEYLNRYMFFFILCRVVWGKLSIRFSLWQGVDLERQQRRREQNRQAAQRCRKRKRDLADTLNRVRLNHWGLKLLNDNNIIVNLKPRWWHLLKIWATNIFSILCYHQYVYTVKHNIKQWIEWQIL